MTDSKLDIKYRQAAIEPFWSMLPFLFRFPFRAGPLIFIGFIVVASVLAGFVLGPFGLVFRGILIYLGLRYAFNVLDLFAKGRFEGESVDHPLWGSQETRPPKLGLVIAIFIGLSVALANVAVQSRMSRDVRAQDIVVADYQRVHAKEIAERERARKEWAEQRAEWQRERAAAIQQARQAARDAGEPEPPFEPEPEVEAERAADSGPGRAEILAAHAPQTFDALWWKLLPMWFWFVVGAASLWLPSAALVIAIDDAFFKALNPLHVGYFMRTMGAAYFVLWFFVLAIVGARQIVLLVGAAWPTFVRLPVEMGLGAYLGIVLCALMGYVIYQFHQELHLEVEVDFDTHRKAGGAAAIASAGSARAAVASAFPMDALEHRVQAALAKGDIKEAIAEVKDELRYDRLDPALNARLHALYMRAGDRNVTLDHGQLWLSGLARAGDSKGLLAAMHKLRTIEPQFTPRNGDVVLPLAQAAERAGERELALELLRGFAPRFAEHRDRADVQAYLDALERAPER